MSNDIIISVEHLSKRYRLGQIGATTLRESAERLWHRLRGRDPAEEMGVVGRRTLNVERKEKNVERRTLNVESRDTATSTESPSRSTSHVLPPTSTVDDLWALKDVSFEVKRGEVLGIIGRNGAGKSTLLKILSRITEPTSGRAVIRGRVGSLLEVGTGFHPELTGRENIYLNGAILGMRKREIDARFDEIVAFSEVERFIDTPVKRYSSGMYVRLAFAVAAHLDPEILLVDEVLAVGDAIFQKKCLGKMGEVAHAGRTVLFVSHNMGAIRALCGRAILLSEGEISSVGKPDDVITDYMEQGNRKEAVVSYPPDFSKEIQIMEVRLLDHGRQPSCRLDMLASFTVEIEYEVRQEVSGVVVGAGVFTSLNESLLATCDHDLDRSKLGTREVGRHTTWVTFPGELFNSGVFNMVVGISMPGKHIYDRREVMQFEMFDSGSFVANGGGEKRRNSILLMGLPWETKTQAAANRGEFG